MGCFGSLQGKNRPIGGFWRFYARSATNCRGEFMLQLIAFLGNPGPEYARNRHNAAWLLAERLPFYASLEWRKKYKGRYAFREGIHFLKPETFMNLSGESVFAAASFFKIKPEEILIVHDELELALGTGSLKFSGGLGGHNGLRSLKAAFGTADFWRLRIGIGRPNHDDIYNWVLSNFSAAEEPVLDRTLEALAGVLLRVLLEGPEPLLPEWNKKKIGQER
jgi:PTH1 family peptidyl-tRNA hydrolase